VKRLILVGVLLVSLAMALSSSVMGFSTYSTSQRGTIKIISGHMVSDTLALSSPALYYNGATTNHDFGNLTLPCAIGDFNRTMTQFCFHAVGPVNMTVASYWNERTEFVFNATGPNQWFNDTLADAISNGLNPDDMYSHIAVTTDTTNWDCEIFYYLDNPTGMNNVITYKQTDRANPKVGGVWAVNDTANFTLPFDINLYLKIGYPTTVAGTPTHYPWANGTTVSDSDVLWVDYQKYGAAHDLSTSDVTGSAGDVTVTFTSRDLLSHATWDITFADAEWQGLFATATSPVTVTVNGDKMAASDVTLGTGTLALKNVAIDNDDNEVVFTWATGGGGTTTPPTTAQPWYAPLNQEPIQGVPYWAVIAVIAVIVIAGIAIWKQEK